MENTYRFSPVFMLALDRYALAFKMSVSMLIGGVDSLFKISVDACVWKTQFVNRHLEKM